MQTIGPMHLSHGPAHQYWVSMCLTNHGVLIGYQVQEYSERPWGGLGPVGRPQEFTTLKEAVAEAERLVKIEKTRALIQGHPTT